MNQFKSDNNQTDTANQGNSNPEPSTIDPCRNKDIITNASQNKCVYEQEKWPSRIMAGTTIVIAFITFFYMLAAFEQVKQTKETVYIAQKTLLATQRPWITVNMNIVSGLKFTEQGTSITIRFIVKNVGNSPAIGADIHAKVYVGNPNEEMFTEQKKTCGKRMHPAPPNSTFYGYVLFPGEHFIQDHTFPISQKDIDKYRSDFAKSFKDSTPINYITPILVGCITYRFTVDESPHETGFIATIDKLDPTRPGRFAISITAGDIPADMLVLQTFPAGSYAN